MSIRHPLDPVVDCSQLVNEMSPSGMALALGARIMRVRFSPSRQTSCVERLTSMNLV
jgi:hypothetical protein